MTAKEYYKSTRMVETRNWTLEMTLNFAEEYAEALRQPPVISLVCDKCEGHIDTDALGRYCTNCEKYVD
jgi:hypothetical protein